MISRRGAPLWFVSLLVVSQARAAPPRSVAAIAKSGGGQLALAVGFDISGQLRARVCAHEPCTLDGGTAIPVPEEVTRRAEHARLRVVRIGQGRKAIIVDIPAAAVSNPASNGVSNPVSNPWTALVVAPLFGDTPLVPFAGYTGYVEGVEGERSGPTVVAREEGVYVGAEREGYDLCGRPAILAPAVLDPTSLTLKPAKLQRLTDDERAGAPLLVAKPADGPPPPLLLHSLWATSAARGAPASALTDGNVETAWAENRGGAGRGEFVVSRVPREVPLRAFELAVPTRQDPHTGVPTDLWLVTDAALFHVELPKDAGRVAGARYEVSLPAPVQTSCVAIVLDGASSEDVDVRVGVSEIWARPVSAASTADLVQALKGGGPDARAAAAILRASGPDGLGAAASAFDGLDEGGQRAVLDVIDDAPCDIALPVYIDALVGPTEAERLHARSALLRCNSSMAPAFVAALGRLPAPARRILAIEIAAVSPEAAVRALVPRLVASDASERRAYRDAIDLAAQSLAARSAVLEALEDESLARAATLDLLRALGRELPKFGPSASHAFGRISTAPDASFRDRFLLLGPAAALAPDDGSARTFLRQALSADRDEHLRAEAARVLVDAKPFSSELMRLLDDPAVRVREASVSALGTGGIDAARDRIVTVLERDPWPLVRGAAARALVGLGPGRASDDALGAALDDPSEDVKVAALWGIGTRRASTNTARVRERLDDSAESPRVRASAAATLGLLCDAHSLDALTKDARRLVSPGADEDERLIARSALGALGMVHPPDLAARVAPLRSKGIPAPIRELADATLAMKSRCGGISSKVGSTK